MTRKAIPMNVKTLTALVGTLSLGALATGCATAKPATAPSEQGSATVNSAAATPEKAAEGSCSGKAAPTTEKAAEHGCSAGGCGASGCGGKK